MPSSRLHRSLSALCTSTSSHKWETYRRRRFGRFSRRRATSILRSVRKERATQKIGQSAIGPPGWLEKGPSASLLVRQVSQRIRSSLAPSIQTLLKPTVCLPLMRRCTNHAKIIRVPSIPINLRSRKMWAGRLFGSSITKLRPARQVNFSPVIRSSTW
jgi:hypothetical protein